MEKILSVRDVGHQRFLFQAVFDGLFVKVRNRLANGKTVCKAYGYSKRKWCSYSRESLSLKTCWLTVFSKKETTSIGHLLIVPKRPLFLINTGRHSEFRNLLKLSSLFYYSTQHKPSEQFDSEAKVYRDSDKSNKLSYTNRNSKLWSLPESSLPEQPLSGIKRVANQDQATVSLTPSEGDTMKSPETSRVCTSGAPEASDDIENVDVMEKKPGIFKRFHQAYKQYGKVLVAVHIFSSSIWTGMFYVIAMSGVNVEPFLRWIGAGDKIISFYTMPGVGHLAVAYLMYKLATPARYAVTIGGTHLAVKWLTQWGYMKPIPESDRLKSLVKDGKTKVKAKYEKYQDKMDDIRDELKELKTKEIRHK